MTRFLQVFGLVLTLAYFCALLFMFNGRVAEIMLMKPNEIGDLLAGVFGPLAILWLILGFFQQGIELRQNTLALKIQAEELRNSVEQQRELVVQQRELVVFTKKQYEFSRDALEHEREKEVRAAKPRFVFSGVNATSGPGYSGTLYSPVLENLGASASQVRIISSQDINVAGSREFNFFDSKSQHKIQWQSSGKKPGEESWIIIQYVDSLGISGSQKFLAIADENNHFTGKIVCEMQA